ncbi:hypothetical protein A3D03_03200 [Candidatus Gottesmanbacteria bacterium RIFCSPHIGHO2_02_FULL_40_13]|uniref:ECF transporter S component n=1 Tax=Candidatus Gottesmanbacteria bacterium RIFCSPHIGHO2_02_FULL_40_13 TaxID=1798384 RepID=A0A1F6A6M8_9BACT|nr:MAG: hypothetical protein A3D03_03200 [Candidatus Gottesmanbacteria bacterium RIFCSPHIGHO2_02_FULL_40_13]
MEKFSDRTVSEVRVIALSAALASLSAFLQLYHLGYQSPQWGMWLDLVAVTWIIAYFLFSLRSALIVSILGFIIITLFAPDTWLGASMKFVATAPIWLSLAIWARDYRNPKNLITPFILGNILRLLLVLPLNYYYAIPIWTGMTPAQAMTAIPWTIIAVFNIIQTAIDLLLAWVLVYRFRLDRFSTRKSQHDQTLKT